PRLPRQRARPPVANNRRPAPLRHAAPRYGRHRTRTALRIRDRRDRGSARYCISPNHHSRAGANGDDGRKARPCPPISPPARALPAAPYTYSNRKQNNTFKAFACTRQPISQFAFLFSTWKVSPEYGPYLRLLSEHWKNHVATYRCHRTRQFQGQPSG